MQLASAFNDQLAETDPLTTGSVAANLVLGAMHKLSDATDEHCLEMAACAELAAETQEQSRRPRLEEMLDVHRAISREIPDLDLVIDRAVLGYSRDAIARYTGRTVPAINNRLVRAVKRLRAET